MFSIREVFTGIFILAAIILFCWVLPPVKSGKSDNDRAIDACIDAGGVPNFSKFNGAFDVCQFPPEGEK